jgi:hypothetical protein
MMRMLDVNSTSYGFGDRGRRVVGENSIHFGANDHEFD